MNFENYRNFPMNFQFEQYDSTDTPSAFIEQGKWVNELLKKS